MGRLEPPKADSADRSLRRSTRGGPTPDVPARGDSASILTTRFREQPDSPLGLPSADFLLRHPPIRHEHQLPNDPALMLDGNRVAGLALVRQGAGDTDSLFQAVRLSRSEEHTSELQSLRH